jgi:predicted nucleotide-binding protein
MTTDELRALLKARNVTFSEKGVQGGTRFDCKSGEIFNVFSTGKMSFQGKPDTSLAQEIRDLYEGGGTTGDRPREASILPPAASPAIGRPAFIVYGHDTAARDQLELILRRMCVDPIILGNLPAAGDTIIEKLEHYLGEHGNVGFACVLLTPDDEGHKAGMTEEKKYRARQNVVLETGMVLARLGRKRVAILHKHSVELPSDIAGLLYIPFVERVDEVKARLFNELRRPAMIPT